MTKRLAEALAFIREYHAKWGVVPEPVEIADRFRVGVGTAKNYRNDLAKRGYLTKSVGAQARLGSVVVYRLKETT